MKKILLLAVIAITLVFCGCGKNNESPDIETPEDTLIKDGSGNIYTEIVVGSQIWLKEDLKTRKYTDGTDIRKPEAGSLTTFPAYEDRGIYGFYYNFMAVETNKLCPKGYVVPTVVDFEKLIAYFGGENIDKETIIDKYVNTWFGKSNGDGPILNAGSGIYGTSTKSPYNEMRAFHMYYRTIEPVGVGILNSEIIGRHNIRCIKAN